VWVGNGRLYELRVQTTAEGFAVGKRRLTLSKPVLKAPTVSCLKRQYDETLSNFDFSVSLRRYHAASEPVLNTIRDSFRPFEIDPEFTNGITNGGVLLMVFFVCNIHRASRRFTW